MSDNISDTRNIDDRAEIKMPPYPCTVDLWSYLAGQSRPIVVYGMGNGADKLFARLEQYGVGVADIFASDGFVRGHSFRGMRVLSFSEIREKYDDFIILLSFASSRTEVLSMLSDIDAHYEMYIPDMPVAGEEYFDAAFYNEHYRELAQTLSLLADDKSKRMFCSILNYKLSGKMHFLEEAYSDKRELYSLIGEGVRSYMDVGAYNGDTLREAMDFFPQLSDAVAIEPDPKTYRRLEKFVATVNTVNIKTLCAAAWCTDGDGSFISSSNRNSSVASTASFRHKETAVALVAPDSLGVAPDYIKYDVEGAEKEALDGSHRMIEKCRPRMLVSAYHRSCDIFALALRLHERYPFYDIYLRRTRCVPAWEVAFILLPRERMSTERAGESN